MTTFPQPETSPQWPLTSEPHAIYGLEAPVAIVAAKRPPHECKWKPGTPAHDKHCIPEASTTIMLAIAALVALAHRQRH